MVRSHMPGNSNNNNSNDSNNSSNNNDRDRISKSISSSISIGDTLVREECNRVCSRGLSGVLIRCVHKVC